VELPTLSDRDKLRFLPVSFWHLFAVGMAKFPVSARLHCSDDVRNAELYTIDVGLVASASSQGGRDGHFTDRASSCGGGSDHFRLIAGAQTAVAARPK
jgi:hypothetical protein